MRHLLCVLLILLCRPLSAGAQCGFDRLHQRRLQEDTAYAAAVRAFNNAWVAYKAVGGNQKLIVNVKDSSYEIPLVLHVLHNGEPIGSPNNPADSQLISLVNYANATFEASWPGYPTPTTGGVRTRIRFVLAKVDRNCQPTSGIVRVNAASVPGYAANGIHYPGGSGNGVDERILKSLSFWGANDYLNVWLVNKIDAGYWGYAKFPSWFPGIDDGVIMYVGAAIAGISTLTHELGHFLYLYHTFEGENNGQPCPPLNDCLNTGDLVCDTEPDKEYPSCTATINPCTGMPYAGVRYNYMNYSHCTQDRFTPGQRDRMLFTLSYNWSFLQYSRTGDSLKPLTAMVPAKCVTTPAPTSKPIWSIGGPVLVAFNDIYRVSRNCREEDSSYYVDNTCLYRTKVIPGNTYQLTVKVSNVPQDVRAYLDLNNNGGFELPAEEIMSVNSVSSGQSKSVNVVIPRTGVVLNKPLRMRIVCDSAGNKSIGPCGVLRTGQAEDYAVTVTPTSAVSPLHELKATAYPNPAQGVLHISFERPFTGVVSLWNTLGQRVYTKAIEGISTHGIPAGNLPEGIYMLTLQEASGEKTAVLKTSIQH